MTIRYRYDELNWLDMREAIVQQPAVLLPFGTVEDQERGQIALEYFNWDHPGPSVLSWQDWWSRMSESGVCGDPTVATAEFGRAPFETTVENLIRFVRESKTIPVRPRRDMHSKGAVSCD